MTIRTAASPAEDIGAKPIGVANFRKVKEMSEDNKMFPHKEAEAAGYYASTGWSIADVKNFYPYLSDKQAEEYLDQHEKYIIEAMCRAGNDYIQFMSPDIEVEDEDEDE